MNLATETLTPQATTACVLELYSSVPWALFRRSHIGGCSSCALQPDETLEQLHQHNRIRLTADGPIRPYLFSLTEHDLRSQLRSDASNDAIQEYLKSVVLQKEDRHHIAEPYFVQPERTMSCIGG